jgi:hypothetical protein
MVAERRLTFVVHGVYRRNMVIRDRQTGSIWQQATGECIAGPMEGERLTPLGGAMLRWHVWRAENPDGVLSTEPDPPVTGFISNKAMTRLLEGTRHFAGPGWSSRGDRRLPLHTEIIGVEVDSAAKAYPLDLLREHGILEDMLNGEMITLVYDEQADRARAWCQNQELHVERQCWLGWVEFHPHTGVYNLEETTTSCHKP